MGRAEFLALVGSAEKQSEHPFAQAIVEGIKEKTISFRDVSEFETIPGYGIRAIVDGKEVLVGTRKLMKKYNVQIEDVLEKMEILENQGKTVMLAAVDGSYAGIVAVADTIKETSTAAIKRMKEMGLEVIMITGDNQQTANAIAKQAGIDQIIAEVFPEGKAEEVKKLQAQGKKVAMVGDGINDAPALAIADIGMAIGRELTWQWKLPILR